jgi:hypothetical protein
MLPIGFDNTRGGKRKKLCQQFLPCKEERGDNALGRCEGLSCVIAGRQKHYDKLKIME